MAYTDPGPTSTCPTLLRLPSDVRKRIFYHLFSREWDYCDKLEIRLYDQVVLTTCTRPRDVASADDAAVLRTCHLFHLEALPVLYDCSKFIVTMGARGDLEGLELGSVASTRPIWQAVRHDKLNIHGNGLCKRLPFTVGSWVTAVQGNNNLNVSEINVETRSMHAALMVRILKVLNSSRYHHPPKIWLQGSSKGLRSSLKPSLQNLLVTSGGSDCSKEFDEEEKRSRIPGAESAIEVGVTIRKAEDHSSGQVEPIKRTRLYPRWTLMSPHTVAVNV